MIAVSAVRTGAGKSQTSRRLAGLLRDRGCRVAVVRYPMPYGDLVAQRVQRFATVEDMKRHQCTIEEMEAYEPHITSGTVVYAGVDYADILERAESDADVILWDGGNNDLPFYVDFPDPERPPMATRRGGARLSSVVRVDPLHGGTPVGGRGHENSRRPVADLQQSWSCHDAHHLPATLFRNTTEPVIPCRA